MIQGIPFYIQNQESVRAAKMDAVVLPFLVIIPEITWK
jgi:hypothetical protein